MKINKKLLDFGPAPSEEARVQREMMDLGSPNSLQYNTKNMY